MRILSDYLLSRKQCVKIGTSTSAYISINSGVPQGSVLSPILFAVFINDIFENLSGSIAAYANDIKIGGTPGIQLQQTINALSEWTKRNSMPINIFKCEILYLGSKYHCLPYYIDGAIINSVDSIRDLGLVIDKSLNFNKHATQVVTKCHKLIGLIFKIFTSQNALLYINAFKSYVLPCIEYLAIFLYIYFNLI